MRWRPATDVVDCLPRVSLETLRDRDLAFEFVGAQSWLPGCLAAAAPPPPGLWPGAPPSTPPRPRSTFPFDGRRRRIRLCLCAARINVTNCVALDLREPL